MLSTPYKYQIGNATVYLIGQQTSFKETGNFLESRNQAIEAGANQDKICQVVTAASRSDEGYQKIYEADYSNILYGDGVILSEPKSAGIIQTADCPSVIIFGQDSKNVALVHAGRPALTPAGIANRNIIDLALEKFLETDNANSLKVLVVGGICGQCFKHEQLSGQALVKPFHKFGDDIFVDKKLGSLDLFALIRLQLLQAGVPHQNITKAGPCSFETETLSSYRRDKTLDRNTIIVVLD
jgi:copper oxidase (laccase) domain-containing protein